MWKRRGICLSWCAKKPVTGYAASYQDDVIVNARETPVPGASPSPTPLVTPIPNVTPRPDNPIALMYSDGEWIYLDEYGIPLGILPVPKTGDESDLLLVCRCRSCCCSSCAARDGALRSIAAGRHA